ncbi:hypothetical protein V1511DRAFT_513790 [Dipodascopsis uninucleata]
MIYLASLDIGYHFLSKIIVIPPIGPLLQIIGDPFSENRIRDERSQLWHAAAGTLAETYTVVIIDLRGSGKSPKSPNYASHRVYSKRELAKDSIKVMPYHDIDKFHFIGHEEEPELVTGCAWIIVTRSLKQF